MLSAAHTHTCEHKRTQPSIVNRSEEARSHARRAAVPAEGRERYSSTASAGHGTRRKRTRGCGTTCAGSARSHASHAGRHDAPCPPRRPVVTPLPSPAASATCPDVIAWLLMRVTATARLMSSEGEAPRRWATAASAVANADSVSSTAPDLDSTAEGVVVAAVAYAVPVSMPLCSSASSGRVGRSRMALTLARVTHHTRP